MASDTAPAAVPDPADPPTSTAPSGPAAGPITSLLTPVEPARPTSAAFNLDPANATPDSLNTPAEAQTAGVSSATYQNDANAPQSGGKNSTGNGQQTGVIRAFALAAIERWKKGADARNKRLDIQKAKAQAHQVKEARTVNRAEKIVGGSTNSGTTSGKSLDSKGQKNAGSSGTSKNGKTNAGSGSGSSGSAGRSGSGSGAGSGGSSGGRGAPGGSSSGSSGAKNGSGGGRGSSGSSGHGTSGHGAGGNSPKTSKNDAKGHHQTSKGTDSKKNGGKHGAGTTPETATCGDASGISLSKDKKSKSRDTSSDTGKGGRADSAAKGGSKDSSSGTTGKTKDGSSTRPSSTSDTKTGTDSKKVDLEKKDTKTGKADKAAKDNHLKGSTAPTTNGQPINTKPSREAGYRDGSRTAKATAHVKAYRDGFKDGHGDTSEAAQREKERLDKAHEARKQQRAKDQPVTASSADHQPQGPQPIDVKEVTDKHVVLDGGQTYTRGEIRNLKQYERRIGEKATNMGKAAEGTRQLQAHAEDQADKALKFLEMAKTIEGGDRFIGILTRLHESATIQIREAQELHKRVVRAADNTRVVLINVEIRYGGIYKAVCDSPLTKPAELAWYRK
jgi:hypothetical protein